MSTTAKNMMVRVGADLSGLVSGFKKASGVTGSFAKQASKDVGSMKETLSELKSAYAEITDASSTVDLSTPVAKQITQIKKEIDKLRDKEDDLNGDVAWWSQVEPEGMQYKTQELVGELSSVQSELESLYSKLNQLRGLQSVGESIGLDTLDYSNVNQLVQQIANIEDILEQAGISSVLQEAEDEALSLGAQLAQAKTELKALESAGYGAGDAEWDEMYQQVAMLTAEVNDYKASLTDMGEETEEAAQKTHRLRSAARAVGSVIRTVGSAAKSMGSWIKDAASKITSFGKTSKASSTSVSDLAKSLKRVGVVAAGIKLTKSIFGELRSIIRSYTSQNETLTAQIDSLKSALGSALAPAINVATNALSKMMPYVLGLSNALSELITNLFGAGWSTITAGASAAADATNGATAAQTAYNRTLAGFDQITKLGSSGSDSSTSSISAADIGLPSWITDLPQTLKDAFSTDGFKGVGETLSTALSEGLQQANKSDSSLGKTVAKVIQGAIDGAAGFVENLDYEELGTSIDTFFSDLFGGINWGSLFSTIGTAVGGIGTTIWTAIGDDITATRDYFADEIEAAGGDVVLGIWNGITKAVENVGTWIKDNIFTPFVDGFKKTFNIHSPSKAEEIVSLGSNIIAGIYNGILDKLKSVGTWIKDNVYTPVVEAFENVFGKEGFFANLLKGTMKDSGNLSVDFKANLTSWKDKLTDKAVSFKANLTSWKDKLTDKAVSFKANLTSWKDKLTDKAVSFKANLTSWKDALSDKALSFKAKITQGWSGSLSEALGIDSITSKLDLKLPKIEIDWKTVNVLGKDFKYPTGFNVKWNAQGGILSGAQIFGRVGNTLLGGGEAGREAVLPLDRNTGWMDTIADRVAARVASVGAGAQNLTIYLTLDGKVVTKTVINNINAQAKATGYNPLAAYL